MRSVFHFPLIFRKFKEKIQKKKIQKKIERKKNQNDRGNRKLIK